MLTSFAALAPVFLLIALGALLRVRDFPGAAFWPAAERLVYWLLFPALLLMTTAGADVAAFRSGPLTLALIGAVLVTVGLTLSLRPWLGLDGPAFSSVLQGGIRSNAYVGLAAGAALYGDAGLMVMGIVVLVVVTTVNLVSVAALLRFGRQRADGLHALLGQFARNPLILACLGGFALNATGLGPGEVIGATLEIMGRASLPLGLLCAGAALEIGRLRALRGAIVVASTLKLLIMPAVTALFCKLLGVQGVTAAAAILYTAVPVSASSYVLARQLGGDAPLMAGLITVTTIAGVVTIPLVLALLT